MNPWRHLQLIFRYHKQRWITRILSHRVQYRHPTLVSHPTVIWDYGYEHLDAISLGADVVVQAYAEIVVHKHSPFSAVEGRLTLGDRVFIGTGANLRAAGGAISVGAGSAISQHSVVVAANHNIGAGRPYLYSPWDDTRTGVIIGANVWIGAGCVLLPGTNIGDNAVIAAGAVVNMSVPTGELWGGIPARRLKSLPATERTS